MIDWTPSAIAIQLGPLPLYWYGIAYAVGLAGAYWIMVRQARRFGENPAIIGNGLIVIAIAALVGRPAVPRDRPVALYKDDLLKIVLPPYSGLGVFGGFVTGTIAFIALTRYYRVSAWRWADIVAPGLFVMQAVGRWGNFFNQELYGPPTTLPWGIAIDCAHRVVEYPCATYPLAGDALPSAVPVRVAIGGRRRSRSSCWLSRRPPTVAARGRSPAHRGDLDRRPRDSSWSSCASGTGESATSRRPRSSVPRSW